MDLSAVPFGWLRALCRGKSTAVFGAEVRDGAQRRSTSGKLSQTVRGTAVLTSAVPTSERPLTHYPDTLLTQLARELSGIEARRLALDEMDPVLHTAEYKLLRVVYTQTVVRRVAYQYGFLVR